MPKFRDLGINAIPTTMRPPEVGAGGGGNQGGGGGETQCVQERTCVPDMTVCEGQATCAPETTECRGQATCKPPDYAANPTECVTAFTCLGRKDKEYDKDKEKDDDKRSTAGFAPETIAQLRNQLQSHIDNAEI